MAGFYGGGGPTALFGGPSASAWSSGVAGSMPYASGGLPSGGGLAGGLGGGWGTGLAMGLMGVASAITDMYAAERAMKAAKKAAEFERQMALVRSKNIKRANKQLIGAQVAKYGASGAVIGEGSAGAVVAESAGVGKYNELMAIYAGEMAAQNIIFGGQERRAAGYINAASRVPQTLLSGYQMGIWGPG